MKTTVIIPMAGNGERFRRQGYSLPKYRVRVSGHSLFWWSMASLGQFVEAGGEIIFAARSDHEPDPFIRSECRELGINRYRILRLERPTDGQAATAFEAGRLASRPEDPCLIYNIDTYVEPDWLAPADVRGEGWVPCFPGDGAGWSFALADAGGRVSRVSEKCRISPHATVGLYWFSSLNLYFRCYERHFSGGAGIEAGERYIAPIYNTLIAEGGCVYLREIPKHAVHPLGTPEDVEKFSLQEGGVAWQLS